MFKEEILKTIKKYNLIQNGDKIIVGLSGGPDSISLINVLDEIRKDKTTRLEFGIIAAHINHNIREEAKSDEDYVVKYCKEKNIEVYVLSIDINKKANDNAETVLMNIIRGSGTSGLKGIRPIRDEKFIRPLIETTREKIEEYCKKNNLNPRIDKTNFENDYTRNKTRNILIPLIKEQFNPNIIMTINRLSDIINEENEYLEKLAKQKYKEILIEEKIGKQIVLDLKLFNEQDLVIKKRLILHTIKILQGNAQGIGKVHIEDIIKLCGNNLGNKYLTPNKNLKVLIKNKKIYFISNL